MGSAPNNRFAGSGKVPAADDLAVPISDVYGLVPVARRDEPGRGRRVLREVVLCAVLFPLALVAGGGWLGACFVDLEASRRVARADLLLHETQAAVGAFSTEALLRLHGTAVLEHGSAAASDFRVDLSVQPAGERLLRVIGVLRDNRTSCELSRFWTYRART